jgi:type IV pilus assembly protein PilM
MVGKGRLVIGVDLNATELCVVGMRGSWARAEVVCVGSAPMPAGAMEGSSIGDPPAVAEALRKLLSLMNVEAREAVFGMSGRNVLTRVLDIPNVPDSEMRPVIQGELVHYQILRDDTGAFDYLRLQRPEGPSEGSPQALVMAAEDTVLHGYRMVAELAGLQLIAVEPALLAMYRVAFARIQNEPAALCLALSSSEVEISIISQGQIRLYRRVDMGRNSLVGIPQAARNGRSSARPAAVMLLHADEEETAAPEGLPADPERQINVTGASNLVLEIQRSLDYYSSQYPQAGEIGCAVVTTNDPELQPLAGWLAQALSLDTALAELPAAADAPPSLTAQLSAKEGLRFLGAIGLAMHELPGHPDMVPCFDLSNSRQRRRVAALGSRSRTLALSLAGLFLVGAGLLDFTLGHKASDLDRKLQARVSELKARQKVRQDILDTIQAQTTQLQMLQTRGLPFPQIMDAVARSVAPEAGLTGVSLEASGRLLVTGEAANDKAIIRTLEGLKNTPLFENTSLDTFDRKTNSPTRGLLVTFEISSKLVGADHPAPAAPGAH